MSDDVEFLSDPMSDPIALRSLIYKTFAAIFEYPDKDLVELIRSGDLAKRLKELLSAANPQVVEGADWDALTDAGKEDDALQIEFTRLFDTGASGPPCALYGGLYVGARMQNMEELVRFYNFFGLSMSEEPHELPDHLTTQLEFMHFMAFRESELARVGEDISDMQRAERDFIARHPGRWLPQMHEKMQDQNGMPFFLELTRLMVTFLQSEVDRLVDLVGKVPSSADAQVVKFVN